jgi:hypothetical protein
MKQTSLAATLVGAATEDGASVNESSSRATGCRTCAGTGRYIQPKTLLGRHGYRARSLNSPSTHRKQHAGLAASSVHGDNHTAVERVDGRDFPSRAYRGSFRRPARRRS